MGAESKIEWTDATWPIVQGCDPVSPGCVNCYAVPLLWRMAHNPNEKISGPLQGVTEKHVNRDGETILRFTGKVALREDRLTWPLQWKKGRMIFVPSHGDIFHKDVPDEFIDKIFAVMALCPQHAFQVLTKRAERMREYLKRMQFEACGEDAAWAPRRLDAHACQLSGSPCAAGYMEDVAWPLKNCWLGVSAERQQEADERIPLLLQTPAAIRFVSLEPLLGPIDLTRMPFAGAVEKRHKRDALTGHSYLFGRGVDGNPDATIKVTEPLVSKLDWVIVGGESGTNARPMHPDWVRSLRRQCEAAGVPFFFKQWGEHHPSAEHDPETCPRRLVTPEAVHVSGRREHVPSERFRLVGGREPGWAGMCRVGKKAAGRTLDGRTHDAMPEVRKP